jgi:glyoxylase-like metal-dependent hydrolase (beta-lactamase superfamily II)
MMTAALMDDAMADEPLRGAEVAVPDMTTVRVGEARVTMLNAGDMRTERMGVFPSLSVYCELRGVRVLVDANDYRATMTPDSEYAIADYTPPPPIPTQLASLGVQPDHIAHMVITHAHWDHYAGATVPADSGYAPAFPRAQYYLGAADWGDVELQTALQDPTSLAARTLGMLRARGVLQLVKEPVQLAEGIEILPAPGETPGHQIVRVRSGSETLYVVGDLFHHAVEVEHPDWMVSWANPETMRATRDWLLHDALTDHALLIAAHIAAPGRIERAGSGLRWSDAQLRLTKPCDVG